ncbi:MAG: geranylgeranylglyceryl/heptaprenylglyceryl phosphate synthase [Candidatus Hydrothermia bacterium]|jgi:putative glycerol-1-phosphate prenyltransferase
MSLYEKLFLKGEKKKILVLLDPDKLDDEKLSLLVKESEESSKVAGYLVGSTLLLKSDVDSFVDKLKRKVTKPVILFPGSHAQLTPKADAVLFLSLLSGRNPQYLIDEQIRMAPLIRKMGIEPIPTAYILIESGKITSVEWVTNTRPLPREKKDLIMAHVVASEMLGFKLIYLEAGSGAVMPVPGEIIQSVRKCINIPLIVGGGLKATESIKEAFDSGADFVVIGNKLESDPEFLRRI